MDHGAAHFTFEPEHDKTEPEDHLSCIAHLSAEDILKSAVIEENNFKHSPWAGADNQTFYGHNLDISRKASSQ